VRVTHRLRGLVGDPLRPWITRERPCRAGASVPCGPRLHWPAPWDAADAVFWSAATWFPLALGLMVQEKPHPFWTGAGLCLGLLLIRLQRACGVFANRPLAAIGLRIACALSMGFVFGEV